MTETQAKSDAAEASTQAGDAPVETPDRTDGSTAAASNKPTADVAEPPTTVVRPTLAGLSPTPSSSGSSTTPAPVRSWLRSEVVRYSSTTAMNPVAPGRSIG